MKDELAIWFVMGLAFFNIFVGIVWIADGNMYGFGSLGVGIALLSLWSFLGYVTRRRSRNQ